jgi:hypothetical protein
MAEFRNLVMLLKNEEVSIGPHINKLHYRLTAYFLIASSVVVAAHYVGAAPVACSTKLANPGNRSQFLAFAPLRFLRGPRRLFQRPSKTTAGWARPLCETRPGRGATRIRASAQSARTRASSFRGFIFGCRWSSFCKASSSRRRTTSGKVGRAASSGPWCTTCG